MVPEYFNNILVAYSHIKGTCTGGKFELNGLLVWWSWEIKVGGVIPYLFYLQEKVIILIIFIKCAQKILSYDERVLVTY